MNYTIKEVKKCFQSYNNDGKPLVYSGSEWECRFWTEELLKNTPSGKVVNDGKVGGKL